MAAFKNVHRTVFLEKKYTLTNMHSANVHPDKHVHTHTRIDGLCPDRHYDSCEIISSTPPFANKLLLLFTLFSRPVKLLISAASRGDDKSLHRDERSSTKNTKPSLSLFYFHTHALTRTKKQPSSILSSLVLHLLQSPNANSPLSNYESPYKLQCLKKKKKEKSLSAFVHSKWQQTNTTWLEIIVFISGLVLADVYFSQLIQH